MKRKYNFLALAIFMVAGFIVSGNAHANPVCGTLEDCWILRDYLQEELGDEQDSEVVYTFLRSQISEVNARIDKIMGNAPEKRTTTTGHVFIRDASQPQLGEAWRDESELIWGDIVKEADGIIIRVMSYNKATAYCASIGARLPSKEEFTQLREYMGAKAKAGTNNEYSHHNGKILPNLRGYQFWSSSLNPTSPIFFAFGFNGSNGDLNDMYHLISGDYAVRCVVNY